MRTYSLFAAASIAAAAMLATSCSLSGSDHPEPEPEPSGAPTVEELPDFAGLSLPDDLDDLEIERSRNDSGGLVYIATFSTSAEGAELFCESGENFSSYRGFAPPEDPKWITREFPENTVDGYTVCSGANLRQENVVRRVLITFPDDESAEVLLEAERFNTR
ncbi:hypothetical protein J0910_24485 [Nocardiopsis sp. CNT-189]|uniref:hypothetical protein n=1 Tax=Nocardiopsis oceanisediminis TaxID=2816862 RepID=UPI003B32827D